MGKSPEESSSSKSSTHFVLKVPEELTQPKQRIDRWIAEQLELTRSVVQRLIVQGKVTLDHKETRPSTKLRGGESIVVQIPPPPPTDIVPQDIPLDIVELTESFLVVNKPAGMVVHPGKGNPDGTLANAIVGLLKSPFKEATRPGIAHRIDKGTSGLLVVARCEQTLQELQAQFAAHTVDRKYWALVWGKPTEKFIDQPLGRDPKDRIKFTVRPDGKRAVTHCRILNVGTLENQTVSLIECRLETGRTHQIRVHMQSLGHPIVGDPLYGRKPKAKWHPSLKNLDHQLLHAWLLGFKAGGQQHQYLKHLPEDFQHWLLKSNIPIPKPIL